MRRTGGVLLVLAALSFAGAAWTAIEPARLALRGEGIEGRAAGVLREPLGPFVRLRPIIAYRRAGAERRVLGSGLVAYPAGVAVPVLHDPSTSRAGLPGLAEGWAGPIALLLLALLLGLPGAWLWLRVAREERIRLTPAGLRTRIARGEIITEIRRSIRSRRR
jgi:hypothetical protein